MPPKENEVELSELYALEEQVEDLKDALYDARKQLKNAIIIPEGATNGDIIKAMFPDIEVKPVNFDGVIGYDVWKLDVTCTCETYFTKGLWDAPYKYRKVEE